MANCISKYLVSRTTESRWGIFALCLSIGLFVLSFAPSFFAFYQSSRDGAAMNGYLVWMIVCLVGGVFFILLAFFLWLFWNRHRVVEPEQKIIDKLDEIAKLLKEPRRTIYVRRNKYYNL